MSGDGGDQGRDPGARLPTTPAELARTLRDAADRLMGGWTAATSPGGAPAGPAGALLPPAALSATQVQAVLDDLAARRAQVQALQTQLGLFDDQLAALETSLGPLREWTRAWAGMEQTLTGLWRLPPSDPQR